MSIDLMTEYRVNPHRGTLYVLEEVCYDMECRVAMGLEYLSMVPKLKEIKIMLNAPEGGDIQSALTIYNLIRASKKPVKVIGFGRIYSAGMIILQSPLDPANRFLLETTSLMWHPFEYQGLQGRKDELMTWKAEFDRQVLTAHKILANVLDIDVKSLVKDFSRDVLMSASQAVARGFAAQIIDKLP